MRPSCKSSSTCHVCFVNNFFLSSVFSNQSISYSMSWCAGCLSWWGPLQRGDLCRGFNQLLIDVWLLVSEVSTLNLILLTTQTMVTTGILPLQGKIPMVELGLWINGFYNLNVNIILTNPVFRHWRKFKNLPPPNNFEVVNGLASNVCIFRFFITMCSNGPVGCYRFCRTLRINSRILFRLLAAFQLRCPPQRVCQDVVTDGVSVCGYYQQAPKLSTTGSTVSQTVRFHETLRKAIQGGARH